jgi:hypothetical protein
MQGYKQPWICVAFYLFGGFGFVAALGAMADGAIELGLASLLGAFVLCGFGKGIAIVGQIAYTAEALLLETIRQRPTT